MTDEPRVFKLDVDEYVSSLPWSSRTTDSEKALVAGNLRTLYALLSEEMRPIADAVDRWIVERHPDEFSERLLLAEWAKLHPERWDAGACSCGDVEACDCDECPPTPRKLEEFIQRVMDEKEEVETHESDYVARLAIERRG